MFPASSPLLPYTLILNEVGKAHSDTYIFIYLFLFIVNFNPAVFCGNWAHLSSTVPSVLSHLGSKLQLFGFFFFCHPQGFISALSFENTS